MPSKEVARKNDDVDTMHNAIGGDDCNTKNIIIHTATYSDNVFIDGQPVIRNGDVCDLHNNGLKCVLHNPPLKASSISIFVNGKAIGRIYDLFVEKNPEAPPCNAKIISGSSTVFAG
jgi:uncharacterized Zn-binding protein involved in type VI secretion